MIKTRKTCHQTLSIGGAHIIWLIFFVKTSWRLKIQRCCWQKFSYSYWVRPDSRLCWSSKNFQKLGLSHLSQEIVLRPWPMGVLGWATWPSLGLPLVIWPLGGTCIPRNRFEDQEERLGGFFRLMRPGKEKEWRLHYVGGFASPWAAPFAHFLMCFSRVLATLNGISQNLHL